VNFLYDDIVNVLQNTIGSGYVLECTLTKFSEITKVTAILGLGLEYKGLGLGILSTRR